MKRPDLAAWIVTGVALVGIIACALLHVAIPESLVNLSTASLGAAAGVSFAGGSGLGDMLAQLLAHLQGKPAAVPAPRASVPGPAPLATDPTTGIIPRVASHAP